MKPVRVAQLQQVHHRLLAGKTWRYLRYMHMRKAILPVANEIQTVCAVGAGHALAELALALEFPHLRVTVTDIISKGYPNYHTAMSLAWRYGINNIRFSVWDVTIPTRRRFDLVSSTETLEHIKDVERAAANMRKTASKFVYCLVPFADDITNKSPRYIKMAQRHEHHVVGFSATRISALFPEPIALSGTYWRDAGQIFRKTLDTLTAAQIKDQYMTLLEAAQADLADKIPSGFPEAMGIKILSRVPSR